MALVACPECGKEISDAAKRCPHCGFSIAKPKRKIVVVAICLIAVLGCIAFFVFRSPKIELTPEQEAAVQAVKMVQETLLRPDTIVIYNAYVSEIWSDEGLSTYLSYGAENTNGTMIESIALVSGGADLYFPDSNDALEDVSLAGLQGALYVEIVRGHIAMGAEQWEPVEIDGLY